jgi:hypothetical protein
MTALAEGDLRITLPASVVGRKFDDKATHRLSHCMKAVDFILELEDRVFFVEVKDPENHRSPAENRATFLEDLSSGKIDTELKTKYRDTWLYEWALGRAEKPVTYLVLIGASTLSDAELLARTDALKRQIPITGPDDQPWKKPFVAGCAVMNLAAWNKALPQFPVSRIGLAGVHGRR